MSDTDRPLVNSIVVDRATNAMKLWRPSPSGPRKRAATTDVTSTQTCGSTRAVVLHAVPRRTLCPVVCLAASPGGGSSKTGEPVTDIAPLPPHALTEARARSAHAGVRDSPARDARLRVLISEDAARGPH